MSFSLGSLKTGMHVFLKTPGSFSQPSSYVRCDFGGGAAMWANAGGRSDGHRFRVEVVEPGKRIALQAPTGAYWCAEPSGALPCNRYQRDAWETFTVEYVKSIDTKTMEVHLKSAHGKYVCRELLGLMVANRSEAKGWETFWMEAVEETWSPYAVAWQDWWGSAADKFLDYCAQVLKIKVAMSEFDLPPQIWFDVLKQPVRTVPVTLKNVGTEPWRPEQGFFLAYHLHQLFDGDGSVQGRHWDGVRTALPHAIQPGEQVTIEAKVDLSPMLPGGTSLYMIEWDLLQENYFWFSGKGCPTATQKVIVNPR